MNKSRAKLTLSLLALICLLAMVIAVLLAITAYRIVRFGSQESNNNADVAIVLGAAAWGNKPSPVYKQRIAQAVSLYKSGRVRQIIFTGGTRSAAFPSEAQVGMQFALKLGVPAQSILVETESHTTWENLRNAKVLMADNSMKSALLVSDPLHMLRACALSQTLDMTVAPAPTPSSRFQSWRVWAKFLWRETWTYLVYALTGQADSESTGGVFVYTKPCAPLIDPI